jgi:hypothetical protein
MEYKKIFIERILGTALKSPIISAKIFICSITTEIQMVIYGSGHICQSVFLNTWALKHIYDRHRYDKDAMPDFYLIFDNFLPIMADPDRIYRNIPGKRGQFLFIKRVGGKLCLCSVEILGPRKDIAIVSASITGEKYLDKFTLLWSREDG